MGMVAGKEVDKVVGVGGKVADMGACVVKGKAGAGMVSVVVGMASVAEGEAVGIVVDISVGIVGVG